jgi:hypothetical protein
VGFTLQFRLNLSLPSASSFVEITFNEKVHNFVQLRNPSLTLLPPGWHTGHQRFPIVGCLHTTLPLLEFTDAIANSLQNFIFVGLKISRASTLSTLGSILVHSTPIATVWRATRTQLGERYSREKQERCYCQKNVFLHEYLQFFVADQFLPLDCPYWVANATGQLGLYVNFCCLSASIRTI